MRIFACAVLAMLAPAAGYAPARDTGTSIAVVGGGGRTWDDESSLGTGAVAGGRYEWRLPAGIILELSLDVLTHDRSGGFFESEGRTVFAGASAVKRFGRGDAQPYVLGGVHLAGHTGSTTFEGVRMPRDSLAPGFHGGGGIAVRLGRRFEVGPEARFYAIRAADDVDPAFAWWLGARFGVRF
jgi:hypothetical protein